jgi:hypothetical protein
VIYIVICMVVMVRTVCQPMNSFIESKINSQCGLRHALSLTYRYVHKHVYKHEIMKSCCLTPESPGSGYTAAEENKTESDLCIRECDHVVLQHHPISFHLAP